MSMTREVIQEPLEYVDVKYEPEHKELFKNRYIRLYRATIKPGGKTLYHRHNEDTVYIVIHGGVIGSQVVGSNRYPMEFPKSFGILKKVSWGIRNLLTGYILMPDSFFFVMRHK
ncbi:MAG: hypothetical protein Q8920_09550, partial [Bacillota bacterium]|nr:hypothetical protein [Bacillota bacterium]